MTRALRKCAPAGSTEPEYGGAVLVASDREQMLVWIRFDDHDGNAERIAIGLDAAEARELAGAIMRCAEEVETAARLSAGLSVC